MKSFSRIYTRASDTELKNWNVSDLEIETNVFPDDDQTEQILALFGMASRRDVDKLEGAAYSTLQQEARHPAPVAWLPEDLNQLPRVEEVQAWEFVQPASELVDAPSQQNRNEKVNAEQERVELINQARFEADEILRQARAEADLILQGGQHEVERAKQAGYQAARNELQTAIAATNALVAETRQWQKEFMDNGEHILTEMLKDIAQSLFGEGVRLDAHALQINLNRIMENAQRLGDLNIFLNPRDADLLDPSWSNYQLLITGNKVRIIPSEKIKPGGCVIKGNTGMVDARVETQLAAVLNTLQETSEVVR